LPFAETLAGVTHVDKVACLAFRDHFANAYTALYARTTHSDAFITFGVWPGLNERPSITSKRRPCTECSKSIVTSSSEHRQEQISTPFETHTFR